MKHSNCNDGHPWFVKLYEGDLDTIVSSILDINDATTGYLVDHRQSREYYRQYGPVAWLDAFSSAENVESLHTKICDEKANASTGNRPIDWLKACNILETQDIAQ